MGGVGGHALGGVHGDGISESDVLTHVVAVEDGAGPVTEPSAAMRVAIGSMAATRHRFPLRTESSRRHAIGPA